MTNGQLIIIAKNRIMAANLPLMAVLFREYNADLLRVASQSGPDAMIDRLPV